MHKVYALLITVAVFVPLALAVMTLVSIRPWVLDRGFYKGLMDNNRLYELQLGDQLPDAFTQDLLAAEQLPTQALNAALREIVTADYLHTQALNAIDTAFDFVDGRRTDVVLTFDITPIKLALGGAAGSHFAQSLAALLPDCANGQTPVASDGHLPRCIDTAISVAQATARISAALPALIDTLPDQIEIEDSSDLGMGWFRYDPFIVGSVHSGLDVGIVSITMMALLAGLVGAYLGGADLRARLKWGSSSLFAPASLILFTGLILTTSPVASVISGSMTGARYSEAYREAVSSVLAQVLQHVGTGFVVSGGIACLIALGLLIWSLVTSAEENANPRVIQVPMRNA
jgi:hypothetical protein